MNDNQVANPKLSRFAMRDELDDTHMAQDLGMSFFAGAISTVGVFLLTVVIDLLGANGGLGWQEQGSFYLWWWLAPLITFLVVPPPLLWLSMGEPWIHPPLEFDWPIQAKAFKKYAKLDPIVQNDVKPVYTLVMKLDRDAHVSVVQEATALWQRSCDHLKDERQLQFVHKNEDSFTEAKEQVEKLGARVTAYKAIGTGKKSDTQPKETP